MQKEHTPDISHQAIIAGMKEMMTYYFLRGTCTCSMMSDNLMKTNGLSMR